MKTRQSLSLIHIDVYKRQLIHNRLVTDGLRAKGVNILDDLSQASLDDIIIVRSHGESREFWNKAKEMNLDVVDATCPFVSKIHGLVSRASEDGYNIVIVGDENHPEVQGIKGWCKGEAMVIDSIEKAEKITEDNLFIVCQTTIKAVSYTHLENPPHPAAGPYSVFR